MKKLAMFLLLGIAMASCGKHEEKVVVIKTIHYSLNSASYKVYRPSKGVVTFISLGKEGGEYFNAGDTILVKL